MMGREMMGMEEKEWAAARQMETKAGVAQDDLPST